MPFALDLGTVYTLIIAASLVVSIGALAAARSYPLTSGSACICGASPQPCRHLPTCC